MKWKEVLTIIFSIAGLMWYQSNGLHNRIDDLKDDIRIFSSRFDRHLEGHP